MKQTWAHIQWPINKNKQQIANQWNSLVVNPLNHAARLTTIYNSTRGCISSKTCKAKKRYRPLERAYLVIWLGHERSSQLAESNKNLLIRKSRTVLISWFFQTRFLAFDEYLKHCHPIPFRLSFFQASTKTSGHF